MWEVLGLNRKQERYEEGTQKVGEPGSVKWRKKGNKMEVPQGKRGNG